MVSAMNLKVSYYPSDDILLLENGGQWKDGGNVVENVVAYADAENRPAAIEISGARKLLCQALYAEKENAAPQNFATPATGERPDESEIDRVCWPLTVNYDRKADTLTLGERPAHDLRHRHRRRPHRLLRRRGRIWQIHQRRQAGERRQPAETVPAL